MTPTLMLGEPVVIPHAASALTSAPGVPLTFFTTCPLLCSPHWFLNLGSLGTTADATVPR